MVPTKMSLPMQSIDIVRQVEHGAVGQTLTLTLMTMSLLVIMLF